MAWCCNICGENVAVPQERRRLKAKVIHSSGSASASSPDTDSDSNDISILAVLNKWGANIPKEKENLILCRICHNLVSRMDSTQTALSDVKGKLMDSAVETSFIGAMLIQIFGSSGPQSTSDPSIPVPSPSTPAPSTSTPCPRTGPRTSCNICGKGVPVPQERRRLKVKLKAKDFHFQFHSYSSASSRDLSTLAVLNKWGANIPKEKENLILCKICHQLVSRMESTQNTLVDVKGKLMDRAVETSFIGAMLIQIFSSPGSQSTPDPSTQVLSPSTPAPSTSTPALCPPTCICNICGKGEPDAKKKRRLKAKVIQSSASSPDNDISILAVLNKWGANIPKEKENLLLCGSCYRLVSRVVSTQTALSDVKGKLMDSAVETSFIGAMLIQIFGSSGSQSTPDPSTPVPSPSTSTPAPSTSTPAPCPPTCNICGNVPEAKERRRLKAKVEQSSVFSPDISTLAVLNKWGANIPKEKENLFLCRICYRLVSRVESTQIALSDVKGKLIDSAVETSFIGAMLIQIYSSSGSQSTPDPSTPVTSPSTPAPSTSTSAQGPSTSMPLSTHARGLKRITRTPSPNTARTPRSLRKRPRIGLSPFSNVKKSAPPTHVSSINHHVFFNKQVAQTVMSIHMV